MVALPVDWTVSGKRSVIAASSQSQTRRVKHFDIVKLIAEVSLLCSLPISKSRYPT